MNCKLVQNGERIEGLCPLCVEKTSHRALNELDLCHACKKIYSFIIPV
jgi:ribosomal protein L37AE/L43A